MSSNTAEIARIVLAAVIVFGFGAIAIAWMFAPDHPENREVILMILTALATGYGQVIGYFYRSSSPPEGK